MAGSLFFMTFNDFVNNEETMSFKFEFAIHVAGPQTYPILLERLSFMKHWNNPTLTCTKNGHTEQMRQSVVTHNISYTTLPHR